MKRFQSQFFQSNIEFIGSSLIIHLDMKSGSSWSQRLSSYNPQIGQIETVRMYTHKHDVSGYFLDVLKETEVERAIRRI